MSITFFLKNHNRSIDLPNPHFNPLEAEDPIYNPRTVNESIYPELNVSNTSAAQILNEIGIWKHDEPFEHAGYIDNKKLDDICKHIQKIISTSTGDPHVLVLRGKLQRLDRVLRFAIALNDDIIWC
jgi:hypothetical protein